MASKLPSNPGQIIEEIVSLLQMDLSTYPKDVFSNFFHRLNWNSIDLLVLKPGDLIYRVRLNDGTSYEKVAEISYKPADLCTTWQRASAPGTPIFYGCFIPHDHTQAQQDNAMLSAMFEIVDLQRNRESDELRRFFATYGVWKVKNLFTVPIVATYQDLVDGISTANLNEPRTWIVWPNKEEQVFFDKVATFLKFYFTRTIVNEFDYLPSAVFSEYVMSRGMNGICYPGIKNEYRTFNIALSSYATDRFLDFDYAFEANIFCKSGTYAIQPASLAKAEGENLRFEIRNDSIAEEEALKYIEQRDDARA